jgi:hypothetical protein
MVELFDINTFRTDWNEIPFDVEFDVLVTTEQGGFGIVRAWVEGGCFISESFCGGEEVDDVIAWRK